MRASHEELLSLPVAERIALATRLWDSVAAESPKPVLTAAEQQELARRWADHQQDPASALSWDAVREELLKPYR